MVVGVVEVGDAGGGEDSSAESSGDEVDEENAGSDLMRRRTSARDSGVSAGANSRCGESNLPESNANNWGKRVREDRRHGATIKGDTPEGTTRTSICSRLEKFMLKQY